MKILQISDGYTRINSPESGPIEEVIYEVSKQLVALGHEVTIIERKLPGLKDIEVYSGITIVRLDKRRANVSYLFSLNSPKKLPVLMVDGLSFAISLKKFLNNKKFDIINFNLPLSGIPFLYLNQKLDSQVIYTYHGSSMRLGLSEYTALPIPFRLVQPDALLMKKTKNVVVLNEELREKIINNYKIDPKKIRSIHNALDVTKFKSISVPNADSKLPSLNGKTVILFVGLIVPIKGVEYLIKAANIIVNDYGYPNLLFLLVGSEERDQKYFQYLNRLIERYKLKENFKFTGHINHDILGSIYSICDLFVLPSLDEGFGLVIAEAMSFGKAVIGTNIGGIPTQIVDGWNGFLVKPANQAELAEKIYYLLKNKERRLKMGDNGKKFVLEKFSWHSVALFYEDFYKSLIRLKRENLE